MTMWVIYENPSDYPGQFVVRRWAVGECMVADRFETVTESLESARQSIPAGLYRLGRQVDDDPVIVEVWL